MQENSSKDVTNGAMKIVAHRDEYLKADAEGRMKILSRVYGLTSDKVWKHKQSGKWIISHAGVQTIAAQEGIIVDYATQLLDPQMTVVMAVPRIGQKTYQPTYGEASPKNTTQNYPVAMAEKRAFDRAVLIAVLQQVGGYGSDFYGEDEADDFKRRDLLPTEDEMGPDPGPLPKRHTKKKDIWKVPATELSRNELKDRIAKYTDKMFDLEKDMFKQSWKDADHAGLVSVVQSVENRIAKEG